MEGGGGCNLNSDYFGIGLCETFVSLNPKFKCLMLLLLDCPVTSVLERYSFMCLISPKPYWAS